MIGNTVDIFSPFYWDEDGEKIQVSSLDGASGRITSGPDSRGNVQVDASNGQYVTLAWLAKECLFNEHPHPLNCWGAELLNEIRGSSLDPVEGNVEVEMNVKTGSDYGRGNDVEQVVVNITSNGPSLDTTLGTSLYTLFDQVHESYNRWRRSASIKS